MSEAAHAISDRPEPAPMPRAQKALLGAVLVVAVMLRVWGVGFGLPDLYHPDEPNKIWSSLTIFKTGDPNPHYFLKPAFMIYLNVAAHVPYYLYGRATDRFRTRADMAHPKIIAMGVARTSTPGVFVIGRLMTAAFSVGAVWLLYLVAVRMSGSVWGGILAALFLAVSPGHVEQAHYITPDSYMVFFGLLALFASERIYRGGRTRDYALSGIAVGLAAASKYNGVAFLAVPVSAHFLRLGREGWRDRRFWIHIPGMTLAAFIAVNPYAVLSSREFVSALFNETQHYATQGHEGMEGGAGLWYLRRFALWEGPALLLAGAMIVAARRRRAMWLVALFPMLYVVVVSLIRVRNARTVLPALPFLYLLAGWGAVAWGARLRPAALRVVAVLALVALPLVRSVAFDIDLATPDGRVKAEEWIARNLGPGSGIAVESYSCYADPQRFRVFGAYSLGDYPGGEYLKNGIRYLVMGQEMRERFQRNPESNADRLSRYRFLDERLSPVARFDDGGYEVRIYDLAGTVSKARPPTQTPSPAASP